MYDWRSTTDSIKEFVVGVALDEAARAFPFSRLNDEPVVNDDLSGQPLLVIFDAGPATAAVFRREVENRVLDFRLETSGGLNEARFIDEETGRTWTALTGDGLGGPLAGSQLEQAKSTSSFWFGWKGWYPETSVYDVEA